MTRAILLLVAMAGLLVAGCRADMAKSQAYARARCPANCLAEYVGRGLVRCSCSEQAR